VDRAVAAAAEEQAAQAPEGWIITKARRGDNRRYGDGSVSVTYRGLFVSTTGSRLSQCKSGVILEDTEK
jgi:hypothetical protein